MNPQQKSAYIVYLRKYRRDHPDKVKQWNENYILRAAQRIAEQRSKGDSNSGH